MDELTGLPLAFGKQVQEKKQFGNTSKIQGTKRVSSNLPDGLLNSVSWLYNECVQGNNAAKSEEKGKQVERDDVDQQQIEQPQAAAAEEEEEYSTPIEGSSSSSDLPTTHEVILKDHIKVSLFLTLVSFSSFVPPSLTWFYPV